MKKFKFFSSILSMLIFFSLLVSFVSFSNLLINRPEQGFFAMLFSPVGLCFIILIFTAIAYLFHSQTLKNLLSNYDLIKATHNSILDSSLGFILSNIDGRIIISNNFAKETLEINESYDINIFEILSIKEKLEEDQGFINNRETTIIKHILKVKGKEKVLNIFVKEIENDHEPILLFLFNDLTESKKLLEVEKRFKALLNTLDEPIVLVNKYGYIKEFNSAFSEFVGLETQQIENQKITKVLMNSKLFSFKELGKLGDIFEKMDKTIGTGDISTLINPFKFEILQNQAKKHYIQKLFKVNLSEEDYLLGCIISDITELQLTIEKLNNLNAELEQKIKEKTKELEDTIEKLSEINSLLKKENQERKELYENLRKSQENYKKFIDNIPVGVYRSNLSGKILLANPALAKILECDSVEELLNYSAYHFYKTKEIRNEVLKIHSSKEETLLKVETEMITKKGKKIFVNDYGKAVKDPETNETFFDGIIIDITDKHLIEKELAKRERQYRKLFESLNEILIQVNEDEIIEVVSPFITKVLGYPIEKIIGQSFRKLLLKPDWFDKIKTLLNENGEARNILNEFKDINGQIRILKGDYILFTEETGRKTYEIILQDVTEELELQNFMNAIFTVFKTFNQDKEIYEIVDNIIKAIQFITIVPNFILALKNSETNTLKIVRHNDRFGYRFSRLDLNNKSHPIIDSLYRQKTKIYTEEELEHFWDDNRLQPPSLMISLPLTIQRETLGVIVIYTYAQDQILSRANIYYLNTLAEQISLGLERKLLSEKLNAQLKLFEVLIESIPYPIYYRSFRTQRYRYCNTAFELYVEKPKQEIIGRRPDEIFPEAISKFIMEKDEEIRKSLITQTYQIEHIDSQGNKKTYISIRSPIVLKEIDDEAVVGILIDITERLNYETELRNALEYNKLILELVPSAIFTINKDIMITSWNKEAEMITGFSPEDVIGKKCFFCENIIKYNVCNLIQNPELNSFNENEMLFTTKDGTKILVSKKASILKDELGNITGGIIAFENITLKREIEKRLSYLADTNSRLTTISSLAVNIDDANILVDTILPIALQITESEGVCYIEFSKISDIYTITRIIDYKFSGKESRSVNIPFEKFINTYCGKIFVDREILIIEYADKQKLLPEISFIEKKRFIEVPLQSGEELYGVLFAYGKEFPYTEEEASALDRLALIFATNMDRIKYQNEMQNLLIKQFQINELRSNFINLISHEYRTPLQAIVLSAEILRRHFDKLNPEQRDKQFQRIEKAIKDMSDMLENVILYNKMTQPSEEINLEEVDTKLFFESLIRDFTLYYQDSAKINYNINTNLQQVKVDPKLLHLIFSNLVSNGIKYSQPNPILDIEVNVNEDGIFLKFTDNGIGIDENEIPNIFEPFYRGKNTKTISGTGLGLSIVSNAVNLLGGKINLKSELGKGTTFEIFLPHN